MDIFSNIFCYSLSNIVRYRMSGNKIVAMADESQALISWEEVQAKRDNSSRHFFHFRRILFRQDFANRQSEIALFIHSFS